MAVLKEVAVLVALCFVISTCLCQVSQGGAHVSQGGPHGSQGGPHENQGRVRRQAVQGFGPTWTSCDFTAASKISCHDCSTRLICKQIGGILKPCGPKQPFCNNGICAAEPSPGCS